jgi:hypothetical protein
MDCFHIGVVGLCYTAATPHLHFIKNTYPNIFLDKSLLQLSVEVHPVNTFPFSKALLVKVILFSPHVALNFKLRTTFFTRFFYMQKALCFKLCGHNSLPQKCWSYGWILSYQTTQWHNLRPQHECSRLWNRRPHGGFK